MEKKVLRTMFETGGDSPEKIVKDEGLIQISDEGGSSKKIIEKKYYLKMNNP